ncbi:MAG: hypothetical protein MRY83_05460 [Flavobacteriales bacterium]|nr:hypothetical protein [Flavobacteriales bacterium]
MFKARFIHFSLFFVLYLCSIGCKKEDSDTKGECPTPNLVELNCSEPVLDMSLNNFTVEYDSDSNKIAEGTYENGVKKGFWKFYNSSENLTKEGNFDDGKISGFWKVYYDNGNLREEGHYEDCQRVGFWKFYFEDANNQVQFEGDFQEDQQINTWKSYASNGELLEEGDCGN